MGFYQKFLANKGTIEGKAIIKLMIVALSVTFSFCGLSASSALGLLRGRITQAEIRWRVFGPNTPKLEDQNTVE